MAGEPSGDVHPEVKLQMSGLQHSTDFTPVRLTGSQLLNVGQFGLEVVLLARNLSVTLCPPRNSRPHGFPCGLSTLWKLLRSNVFSL